MYTRNELKKFWDSILINAASRTALKKFSQNPIVYATGQQGTDSSHYYTPRTEFFVDKMILTFKDQFLDTFGPVVYVLEHCGINLWVFLLTRFLINAVVMIVRCMEIDKITGSTIGFVKILLSASYNIFLTSVLTFMHNPTAPAIAAVEHMEVGPYVENDMHEVKEDEKKRRAPLPCNEHGNTTIVTCLKFFFVYWFLVFRFSVNGKRRFIACLNRSGIRLPSFDAFNYGTANWANSNFFSRLLQPLSRQTLLHQTQNQTPSQQLRDYLHFALLPLSPLTNNNLQPFLLLLETLHPRVYLPAAHAPNLSESYAICCDPAAKIQ